MSPSWLFSTALALASLASAHPGHHHASLARRISSGTPTTTADASWYHPEDSPYHKLFRRGAPVTDGVQYAQVGSPEWTAAYPSSTPTAMPQAWTDALNAAISAGSIPNLAPSTLDPNGTLYYSSGLDPNTLPLCSATWKCKLQGDLWDAPDGEVGISFDDGPIQGSSDTLYGFLQQNNIQATHFFIGVNIIENWKEFNIALNMGGDIAVHTWTHPYMTSLTSEQVAMQLGWTIELIHNSTGGRIPRFWRPPYGDTDARVSAIAKEVFGLQTVIWNHDTEDWNIGNDGITLDMVKGNLTSWYSGPKSPGLIILEHELTNNTVTGFIDTYNIAVQNGWKAVSVAQLDGKGTPYQNAQGSTGAVKEEDNILAGVASGSNQSAASGTASSASSGSSPSQSAAAGSASGDAPVTVTSTVIVAPSTSATGGSTAVGASNGNTSGALMVSASIFVALIIASVSGVTVLSF